MPPDSQCSSLSHSAGPLYLESVAESIIETPPPKIKKKAGGAEGTKIPWIPFKQVMTERREEEESERDTVKETDYPLESVQPV